MEKKLYSSLNEIEIDQVCGILEENNIPFIRKDAGSGSYMKVYMGESIQEKTIYVNENDFEKASELIYFITQTDENDVNEEYNEENEELKEDVKKYSKVRRLFGIIIIFGIPIICVICVILAIIKNL